MEKKRKKVSEKTVQKAETFKPATVQVQPQMQLQAMQAKPQPALNEKDKAILDDVSHIIWNPDLLKKLNGSKATMPDGRMKKKLT